MVLSMGNRLLLGAVLTAVSCLWGANFVFAMDPYGTANSAQQAQPAQAVQAQPAQQAKASLKQSSKITPMGIERAQGERLSIAIGHYSRSRALLLKAIREFDVARQYASPEVLIDVQEWRSSLVSRAEELERVMAPQARASRAGVRFESARELLKTGE